MTDDAGTDSPRDPLLSLRALREAAGREIEGLARELHIDPGLLEALEAGDYERLGAPVYVKGHLKRYASAIGADAAALLADYDALHANDAPPPVVATKASNRQRAMVPFWVWLVVGFGAVLVLLLAWFVASSNGSGPPATDQVALTAAPSDTSISAPLPPPARADGTSPLAAPVSTAPAPVTASAAAATNDAPPPTDPAPAVPDTVRVELSYSGDCWTEVRDSSGSVLYSGTGRAGAREQIRGVAPLTVVVGNREVVSVRVNDSPFSIPSGAVRRRTARFTVPAP